MSFDRRPVVLVGATTWWPLSARLAMAFLRHGCRVVAICPPGHPLRFVDGIEAIHTYRGLDSLSSLEAAIRAAKPDLIAPCDDGVVWQLHRIHQSHPAHREIIERSLGPAEHYATLRSRGRFLLAAQELGIRIPETQTITTPDELRRWPSESPAVLKLDGTWGGSGVAIVRSRAEALAAFQRLSTPVSRGAVLKRWAVNRDPLALWSLHGHEESTVSIQQFIPGRPANTMMVCWNGQMLANLSVEVLSAQGATGAATVVRVIDHPEIDQAARLIAFRFQLTGCYGLDFILEEETHAAYLIELNPRATQLGHLRLEGQGDLAHSLAAHIGASIDPSETVDCAIGSTIAFFPQAFNWNPHSPYLRSAYHDVPWEQPHLVREILRPIWPERQRLYRLYHRIRPLRELAEANFDEAPKTAALR
ncbi:MAG TPA: ATP-grasp domain-containing protein [Acidobacteriaceae bacterium]|nr:ATP-grasp domain-containing protein [Acidobacteriaceae bacterium]